MINRVSYLIISLFSITEIPAQYSVHTINTDRQFYSWIDSGVNCSQNTTKYWYALKEEMDNVVKQKVRYCGGSVLYVGLRNGIHLYSQNINVSCDSVTNLLKMDGNFINLLPLIAEEKISYEIYNDTDLYYTDSIHKIFGASVGLNIPISDAVVNILKACVDSIDTTGNNCHVYGTINDMLCIAEKSIVIGVNDLKKETPMTIKVPSKNQFNNKKKKYSALNKQVILNGRINKEGVQSNGITILKGKVNLNQK